MIKRANQKKKKGFSLIELIIVLAVMAIIALIAIPNFTAVRNNSKAKADDQSCETIKRTVLMLVADDTVSLKNATKPGSFELSFGTDGKTPTILQTKVDNVQEKVTGTDAEMGTGDDADKVVTPAKDGSLSLALKETNKPQAKGDKFLVTIKVDGSVEVEVK